MRQIEFRGKSLDNGEWVYGCFYEYQNKNIISRNYVERQTMQDPSGTWTYQENEVNPSTVGQFTGLTDKNGKNIFEGDKGKRPSSNGTEEKMAYGEIVFYKGSFCFHRVDSNLRITVDNLVYHYSDLEIIGNIHDNPELLNQQQ